MLLPPDLRECVPRGRHGQCGWDADPGERLKRQECPLDRYDCAGELDRQMQRDIAEPLEQAERTDRRKDDDGQSLPKEIARRSATQTARPFTTADP